MKKYCEECGREVETKIVTKKETYNVCGDEITVDAQILTCANCGEELFCEELDNATLVKAYNEYRKKHKLLFPEEIKGIREQYGLSQRAFAKLLNWGDKTICRYENGSIQDKAHNALLQFLRNPENMREYLQKNEVSFDTKQEARLVAYINKLMPSQPKESFFNLYVSSEPSIENGFKAFDYEKFCAMVLFFAEKDPELLKTKLLKLLNYSDMVYYQENGTSISGSRYVHLPFGPVPENYDILFGTMTADHIAHIEVAYENGYEKHQVVPDTNIPDGVLTDAELNLMDRIYKKFATFGSAEISNYSHKEKGYKSTKQGEIISYQYAKDIQF